jgi:serine protease Do
MKLSPLFLALSLSATAVPALAQKPPEKPNPAKPEKSDKPQAQATPEQPPIAPQVVAEAKRVSQAIVAVADRAGASVVQIDVTSRDEPATGTKLRGAAGAVSRSTGSGIVLSTDGAVVTNNHVIEDALSINVRLRDGRYLPARFIGRDPATDLAVLKIDAAGLTPAKLADSDAAKVGEMVVAIGSPFGLGYSVTSGVLSAKGRAGLGVNDLEDYLQTDASINPGNSGGPLCDLEGRVVGVNTMIIGRGTGIGFAVPANVVRRVAEQLVKSGRVDRPWIGIGVQDVTPELAQELKVEPKGGVLVNDVADGSPGQKGNLRAGDVIATAFGKKLSDTREFIREVLLKDVGTDVPLEIIREGKRYASAIRLTARTEAPVPPIPLQQQSVPQSGLGFTLRDLSATAAGQAGLGQKAVVVVTGVTAGSAADRAGLRVNDAILEADTLADPSAAKVQDAAKDNSLMLRVRRADKVFYTVVKK